MLVDEEGEGKNQEVMDRNVLHREQRLRPDAHFINTTKEFYASTFFFPFPVKNRYVGGEVRTV